MAYFREPLKSFNNSRALDALPLPQLRRLRMESGARSLTATSTLFARYFGVHGYPGEKKNETLLWQKAEELLPEKGNETSDEGEIEVYTQALMDLGATVCTHGKPN